MPHLLALTFDAAVESNIEQILNLDAECNAVKLPKETRQASQKLGLRLLKIFQEFCDDNLLNQYREAINTGNAVGHYSIAFGLIAAIQQIDKEEALTGFYYNAAMGMITNSVKLIPLGQQDGQKLLFEIMPVIERLVNSVQPIGRDKIGAMLYRV